MHSKETAAVALTTTMTAVAVAVEQIRLGRKVLLLTDSSARSLRNQGRKSGPSADFH